MRLIERRVVECVACDSSESEPCSDHALSDTSSDTYEVTREFAGGSTPCCPGECGRMKGELLRAAPPALEGTASPEEGRASIGE